LRPSRSPAQVILEVVREFRTVGGYFRHDSTTRHTRKRRSARGDWVRAASRVAALSRLFALQRGAEGPGVPGTPYLTAWANSGKSRREQKLRLMASKASPIPS